MKYLIFTYLLSYGGSLAALFRPFAGVCIYVSLALIKPTDTWQWAVPDGPYAKVIMIATIVGWAVKGFGTWTFGRAKPVVFCLGAFVAWSALSMIIVAKDQAIASYFVSVMFKVFLPFLIAMTLIDSVYKLKVLAWTIVLSMGAVAVEHNMYYLSMGHVPGYIGMNGIAHEMAAGVGLAVFLGLFSTKWWQKWLCWWLAALMAHVSLFNMSRGAMIGLAVTGIIVLYKMPKNRETIRLLVLGVIGLTIIAGPAIVEEFATIFASEGERDGSAQSRLDLWADMLTVAFSSPLFGIGPSHWPTVAADFGWRDGKQGHGLWVQYCAELGFVGAGFIMSFYAICLLRIWRLSNQFIETDNWLLVPLLGVPASVCAWIVEAQFGSFWTYEAPFYLILLGAATLRVISVDIPLKEAESEELRLRELEQKPS